MTGTTGDRSKRRAIPGAATRKIKLIPAHFSWTHNAPRPVHPRALREASLSGTGERWPRPGATRTPNARRLKLHRSRRHSWRHRALWRQRRNSVPNGQALPGPKRWIENSATGGHAEESLKHRARDAGEKADLRVFSGISAGLLDLAASRAPSDFFRRRIGPNNSGAKRAARTMEADLQDAVDMRVAKYGIQAHIQAMPAKLKSPAAKPAAAKAAAVKSAAVAGALKRATTSSWSTARATSSAPTTRCRR